jgi:uncharacterized OB-fold protein
VSRPENTYDKPLPDVRDPVAAPFWAGTRAGRVTAQRCDTCDAWRWPPAPICPECLASGGSWTELSGLGRIWSVAVYHRAFHPGFAGDLPYAVLLVELDEGPRLISNFAGDPSLAEVGQRVRAVLDAVTDDVTLVRFEPIESGVE